MDSLDRANKKEFNTGYQSVATNTGDWSAAIPNTGNRSVATNTGHWGVATNTGIQSATISTGEASVATVEGKESIAIATGIKSRAKGSLGCYIVLAEWYRNECGSWHIKHVQSAKVDGEKIKADTFYRFKERGICGGEVMYKKGDKFVIEIDKLIMFDGRVSYETKGPYSFIL